MKKTKMLKDNSKGTETGVAAVERALKVLDCFRRGDRAVSLTDLSERSGLYKSTVLRLLSSLETYGYIRVNESGLYSIGSKPLLLAALFQEAVQPHELILPILRALVDRTGESASYNIRQGKARICVYRVDSPHRIRDHLRPGDTLPLGRGAAGRVLAAFADPDDPKHAEVRARLVVRAVADLDPETAGIAAPVFGENGTVAGALAVSGPRSRFDEKSMDRMERALLDSAKLLTGQLGGDARAFDSRERASADEPDRSGSVMGNRRRRLSLAR